MAAVRQVVALRIGSRVDVIEVLDHASPKAIAEDVFIVADRPEDVLVAADGPDLSVQTSKSGAQTHPHPGPLARHGVRDGVAAGLRGAVAAIAMIMLTTTRTAVTRSVADDAARVFTDSDLVLVVVVIDPTEQGQGLVITWYRRADVNVIVVSGVLGLHLGRQPCGKGDAGTGTDAGRALSGAGHCFRLGGGVLSDRVTL